MSSCEDHLQHNILFLSILMSWLFLCNAPIQNGKMITGRPGFIKLTMKRKNDKENTYVNRR